MVTPNLGDGGLGICDVALSRGGSHVRVDDRGYFWNAYGRNIAMKAKSSNVGIRDIYNCVYRKFGLEAGS